MSTKWTRVSLKGKSHVIPRLCPATLRPATHDLRYGYTSPFYFLSRTTYYQTFYYSADAARAVAERLKCGTRVLWLWIAFVVLAIAGMVGAIIFASAHPRLDFVVWAVPLFLLVIAIAWTIRLRKGALARGPAPADAISNKPSAYYLGTGLNPLGKRAVYKAMRPEWIRALVEANPDKVDDATYATITGSARPLPDTGKPFG